MLIHGIEFKITAQTTISEISGLRWSSFSVNETSSSWLCADDCETCCYVFYWCQFEYLMKLSDSNLLTSIHSAHIPVAFTSETLRREHSVEILKCMTQHWALSTHHSAFEHRLQMFPIFHRTIFKIQIVVKFTRVLLLEMFVHIAIMCYTVNCK